MDLTAELDAPCDAPALFRWVADLATYPRWLGIVDRVEVDADPHDGPDAWIVDLAARVGPFSRSKRLRMVRTVVDEPHRVVFERRERDGREHGTWRMTAELAPTSDGTHLAMHLHYGGRLWGPVLEPILADEVDRSRARLVALVQETSAP